MVLFRKKKKMETRILIVFVGKNEFFKNIFLNLDGDAAPVRDFQYFSPILWEAIVRCNYHKPGGEQMNYISGAVNAKLFTMWSL